MENAIKSKEVKVWKYETVRWKEGGTNERQRMKNGGRGTVLFKQVSVPQKSSADHG